MGSTAKPKPPAWRMRPRDQRTLLIIGDLFAAYASLVAALILWGVRDQWLDFSLEFLQKRVEFWYYFLPFLWLLLLVQIYDPHRANNWKVTLRVIAFAAAAGLFVYAVIYFFFEGAIARIGVGAFLLFASIATILWRLIYIGIFSAPAFMRRVLIIGAGKAGRTLALAYKDIYPPPFHLVGFLDDDPKKVGTSLEGYPVLGSSDQLLAIIENEAISDLVVAIVGEMRGKTFQTILDAQERGLEVIPMPTLYEELLGRVPVHHLESEWLLRSFVDQARVGGFYEVGKRILDILLALVGLVILAVISPLVSLVILIDSGLPITYKQIRLGKGGKPFYVYKFRTMRQDAEKDGKPRLTQERDDRITRVGNFLRRTHIDEFPQFWNVLRGEMSIVGPRSERPEWVAEFQKQIPFYRARLLVKPGITGWAQVNYGYYATVEEMAVKLEYDLYYIKHRNFLMDIFIIARTVGQVLGFRGR